MALRQPDSETSSSTPTRLSFLIGPQREFCRAWPNQETVMVQGAHFLQEEAPDEVGEALARFVANVRAGAMG